MRRFSLYRRGRVYYCQFYNPRTGKYLSGRSTGQTNRNAATLVVHDWLQNGVSDQGGAGRRSVDETIDVDTILETLRKVELTTGDAVRIVEVLKSRELIETAAVKDRPSSEHFVSFLQRFWDFEKSPYVAEKLAHGHRIGRRHCYDYTLWVNLHWKLFFSEKPLGEIRRADLKAFSLHMASKGLAPKTINNILSVGTVALRWAKDNEIIAANPADGLAKFSGEAAKRGVLTETEAQRLFALDWADERARLGNLVAMTTGLRAGEVLGLQTRDIGEDRLYVRHSWSDKDGLKSTKTGVERTVPLLASIRDALLKLARKNPHGIGPSTFIFWSTTRGDRPMDFHPLLDGLKDAFLRLSLSKEEMNDPEKVERTREYWRARRITVHSWRHYYATHLANCVEMRRVQLVTGHKSPAMVAHYADHAREQDFAEVSKAVEEVFGGVIAFRKPNRPTTEDSQKSF